MALGVLGRLHTKELHFTLFQVAADATALQGKQAKGLLPCNMAADRGHFSYRPIQTGDLMSGEVAALAQKDLCWS